MLILSIETSCDETGLSLFSWNEKSTEKNLTLEANILASQIELHALYGGVFPAMAKRAHAEKIVPLFTSVLEKAGLLYFETVSISDELQQKVRTICSHEQVMAEALISFCELHARPSIDCIAVTVGPGLEPALWVGVNFAKALSMLWNIPVLPVNHMEGHVVTALFEYPDEATFVQRDVVYPLLALLVSGGHTELVLSETAGSYKKIGQTVDDAVGEAFDKVARMLDLAYPGGPKISALASGFRTEQIEKNSEQPFAFPKPMQHSGDYNFSFSGLKTAVLYKLKELKESVGEHSLETKNAIAAAFEEAAIGVLVHKVTKAIEEFHPKTFLIGGGVAGNSYLQSELMKALAKYPETTFLIPERQFTTDNAVMIGLAAYVQLQGNAETYSGDDSHIKANGNFSI